MIQLRSAVLQDLDALVNLEDRCFGDQKELTHAHFKRFIQNPRAILWVAEKAGVLCGCIVALTRSNSKKVRVYSAAVLPEYQGQGIAKQLFQTVETEARAQKAEQLYLEVRADNHGAIGLYEKLGYQRFGTYPNYYSDGSAALRMQKCL